MIILNLRWTLRPRPRLKVVVIRWVAKWRSCSLSALAVALLKSCPRLPVAPVVPGWWPHSCPRRRTATWWPPLPSWPLLTRRMRRARPKPSQECRRRRPPAFSTTWKLPYETGNQSASFKKVLQNKAFKYRLIISVWIPFELYLPCLSIYLMTVDEPKNPYLWLALTSFLPFLDRVTHQPMVFIVLP